MFVLLLLEKNIYYFFAGAHNTIVASRAGKDLVSSLCSGLLTIGPRFGGALDDAAAMFTEAVDRCDDFVKLIVIFSKLYF